MQDLMKQWHDKHKQDLRPPLVAWPTLFLFFITLTIFVGTIYLCTQGIMSVYIGFLINAVCQFIMFTITHDASHRSLSQVHWVNDFIGTISTIVLTPIAGIRVFRFIHMQHHRFTNEGVDKDPDQWSAGGPRWLLVFRWMLFDLHYVRWYLKHWNKRPKKEHLELMLVMPSAIALISILTMYGYGWYVLWLWVLSGRIAATMLVATFDYLPHLPHDTTAKESEYRATNIRPTLSWLMTPILLGQNYHLIHHLYPRIPFYRYIWVWHQAEHELRACNARILSWRGEPLHKTELTSTPNKEIAHQPSTVND